MTVNWPQALAGALAGAPISAIIGLVVGGLVVPVYRRFSDRRALGKLYRHLSGDYTNYRVKESGAQEPTGGTIQLAWDSKEGILKATGFHSSGEVDWQSDIRMSREFRDTGTGHYRYPSAVHSGIQQVIYSEGTRSFHVLAVTSNDKHFAQYWKVKL